MRLDNQELHRANLTKFLYFPINSFEHPQKNTSTSNYAVTLTCYKLQLLRTDSISIGVETKQLQESGQISCAKSDRFSHHKCIVSLKEPWYCTYCSSFLSKSE